VSATFKLPTRTLLRWTAGIVLASGTVQGCAGGVIVPAGDPDLIPVLEAAREKRPDDVDMLTSLGAAYYAASEYAQAQAVLSRALTLVPNHFEASTYLGRTLEAMDLLDSARAVYTTAKASSARSGAQREYLEARHATLVHRQLRADARTAAAQEALLAKGPAVGNTVAVLPWRYYGSDEALRPLERGIAHLFVTDLSKVGHLRLVERDRVQALVDELTLVQSARVDPATGVRTGRLLRVEHVIHGTLRDMEPNRVLRLDARVVRTDDAAIQATGSVTDRLHSLFLMQKAVVFQLLDDLGIRLSPAERRAISQRPTDDLQAFLAFSRGLEQADRGDFARAAMEFESAVARDSRFTAARVERDRWRRISAHPFDPPRLPPRMADRATPIQDRVHPVGVGSRWSPVLGRVLRDVVPSRAARLDRRVRTRPPIRRAALPEALQRDDLRDAGTATTPVP
jgi:TolB-like protein